MPALADRRSRVFAASVFIGGAALYALGVEGFGVTFTVTPLWFGVVAITAGCVARRGRLISVGLPLVGWGASVLLIHEAVIPRNRTAAAYLVGAAIGMVAASLWSRHTGTELVGASVSLLSGGLAFYVAFDIDALGRAPVWIVAMLVWAVVEYSRAPGASAAD